MTLLFVLVVAAAAAFYHASTPEERTRFLQEVVHPVAARMDQVLFAAQPFRETLRTRTPRLVVTPVLAGLNLLAFLAALVGDGAFGAPATLVDWGANYGPRTTNGEWWRLLTAAFVQGGPFHLLFVQIGLLQVSALLERMVGPVIVACVYVTAAAGREPGQPVGLSVGRARRRIIRGVRALRSPDRGHGLGISAANRIDDPLAGVPIAASGVRPLPSLQPRNPRARQPARRDRLHHRARRRPGADQDRRRAQAQPAAAAIGMAAAAVLVVSSAWSLRGIVDVRAELVDLVASEDRATMVYRAAIARYTLKRVPVDRRATIELIDGTLLPQLMANRARITRLERPLAEHQAFVLQAAEYLRLREESWRLCVEGWRKSNADKLREAERVERSAFEVLQKLRGIDAAIAVYV